MGSRERERRMREYELERGGWGDKGKGEGRREIGELGNKKGLGGERGGRGLAKRRGREGGE